MCTCDLVRVERGKFRQTERDKSRRRPLQILHLLRWSLTLARALEVILHPSAVRAQLAALTDQVLQ